MRILDDLIRSAAIKSHRPRVDPPGFLAGPQNMARGRLGPAMEPEARPEHEGWVVRGTKTWEEVERDWGHITPIFGNLMGEVELTLGIRAERRSSIGAGVTQ